VKLDIFFFVFFFQIKIIVIIYLTFSKNIFSNLCNYLHLYCVDHEIIKIKF